MTKSSAYVEKYAGPGEDRATRLSLAPGQHKYLFVYPLTKMREWYGLPREERQAIMNQHFAIGATYPTVKINTTYSFGLDDQEFVLAFESDVPGDFLDLVQELRGSTSSAYTLTDVPIFTCVASTAEGMLRALSLRREAVPA
jgi:chlorite dismutase